MNLSFTLNEEDTLAFTEQYLKGSVSHQKLRGRIKWTLPIIMMCILVFLAYKGSIQISTAAIILSGSLAWFFLYPKRFDSNIRKLAKKQINESSYTKNYGEYELCLSDSGIESLSPMGKSCYTWDAVDRVERSDNYLFIFLAGPMGYPIRIDQIGEELSSEVYRYIHKQIRINGAEQGRA